MKVLMMTYEVNQNLLLEEEVREVVVVYNLRSFNNKKIKCPESKSLIQILTETLSILLWKMESS